VAHLEPSPSERQKRRREVRTALLVLVLFIVSLIVQAIVSREDQGYGFLQGLLFFALGILNLLIIGLLLFLVFRNIIKAWLDRRSGKLGSSLRWKMVTALVGFALLPSVLLFVGSTYVIRQGFDQWFGGQVAGALYDAQNITKLHYEDIESDLSFYLKNMVDEFARGKVKLNESGLQNLVGRYPVDGVEVYFDRLRAPIKVQRDKGSHIPRAASDSLERVFAGESFQLIRQIGGSDLVQQFYLVKKPYSSFVVVLSKVVPLAMKTRMKELESALSSYKQTQEIKNTLKTNYSLVLMTLFALNLFVVSWFGLYVTRQVTEPVADLMKATEAFRKGQWSYRIPTPIFRKSEGFLSKEAPDLEVLKAAFNLMGEEVGRRGQKLEKANHQLRLLVKGLEEREKYLETLLSSIRRGVVALDANKRVQRVNKDALGFASSAFRESKDVMSVSGMHWREVFQNVGGVDESKAWLDEVRLNKGDPVDRIFELSRGAGRSLSLRTVRATGILLLDDHAEELGWLIIMEDVSDAARLERLAAWQEVTKRVAHEIKNPLTPVQISADRMLRRLARNPGTNPDEDIFRECCQQIQKQVKVIRDLVREFSQFAKMPEPQFKQVNVAELIEEIIEDYRFTHPHCELVFSNFIKEKKPLVMADPEHIRRVVVNLADNAIHSMEEAKVEKPRFEVLIQELFDREPYVKLSFQDNGPGVSPGLRDKIFDPYMTSKASGLGLGLPIVRRIAVEHRGRVRCEEASYGLFVLELPRLVVDA